MYRYCRKRYRKRWRQQCCCRLRWRRYYRCHCYMKQEQSYQAGAGREVLLKLFSFLFSFQKLLRCIVSQFSGDVNNNNVNYLLFSRFIPHRERKAHRRPKEKKGYFRQAPPRALRSQPVWERELRMRELRRSAQRAVSMRRVRLLSLPR